MYIAIVQANGVRHHLGSWSDGREAAIAVDRASLHFGIDVTLNVPEESRRRGPASPAELKVLARASRPKGRGASRYFGVTRSKDGRYRATICRDGKPFEITRFASEEAAARAYDRVAVGWFGKDARLNFPRERPRAATIDEIRREQGGRPVEDKSSKFRGVHWFEPRQRFAASIRGDGRYWSLGHWESERDAAIAYDRAALHFRGAGAHLNFPKLRLDPASPDEIQREQATRARAKMSSRYEGVSRTRDGWAAYVPLAGARINLGVYEDEAAAALAYDRAALHLFGPEAHRNFPRRRVEAAAPEAIRAERRANVKLRHSSRYDGVTWQPSGRKWVAHIAVGPRVGGKTHHLGVFDTEEEAARARDRALLHLGRDPAKLNFPARGTQPESLDSLKNAAWQRHKEHTTSRYTGVFWSSSQAVWCARIVVDHVVRRLGEFDDEEAAARAYDRAALRYRGDAHRPQWINFPEEWAGLVRSRPRTKKAGRAKRGVTSL